MSLPRSSTRTRSRTTAATNTSYRDDGGNDIINGGTGNDLLDGGIGSDSLVYNAISESPYNPANRSTVQTDFGFIMSTFWVDYVRFTHKSGRNFRWVVTAVFGPSRTLQNKGSVRFACLSWMRLKPLPGHAPGLGQRQVLGKRFALRKFIAGGERAAGAGEYQRNDAGAPGQGARGIGQHPFECGGKRVALSRPVDGDHRDPGAGSAIVKTLSVNPVSYLW